MMRRVRKALTGLAGLLGLMLLLACTQHVRHSGNTALDAPPPGALRIATYNVHYILTRQPTGAWSMADWERRKGPLDQAVKHLAADVIGFQEMESFGGGSMSRENLTLDWLLARNPDLAAAAQGDPAVFPSTQPIFYRTARLRLLDEGWFFFSETPDVIYSRTFNGSWPAFASWARFEDRRTGAAFRVVNLHTDYASRSNRLQSIQLVAERITPWRDAGETIVVLGDFNARLGDPTLEILEDIGVSFAPVQGATYHFNRGINLFGAIDHIGWLGDLSPLGAPQVVRQRFDGEWPTDHYPLVQDMMPGGGN